MNNDCIKDYELEWIREQIYDLQNTVRNLETKVEELQMENTLLRNDLNIIKNEGCWRFVEDSKHLHRIKDE